MRRITVAIPENPPVPAIRRSLALAAVALAVLLPSAWATERTEQGPAADPPAIEPREAAARIDELVEAGLERQGISPRPPAADATLVRRLHLDLVGRIPTSGEATDYLESSDPGKHGDLVDELVGSPGYVSHHFNWWADLLRLKSRLPGQSAVVGAAYADWIRGAIAGNMPYDDFVRELVTAEGRADENGAVGFHLRDRGMPLDHLATTVQTFLGTQIVCAQCHDHPFEEWTQMDYYKLAAFTHGMRTVRVPGELQVRLQEALKEYPPALRRDVQRSLAALLDPFRNSIIRQGPVDLRLPDDYQYDDASPNDPVAPATPFGVFVDGSSNPSPIAAFADWMASPDNPRFALVMANRLWKRAMGVGLLEPVDDVDGAGEAANPELLDHLTNLLIELDFDVQAFQRIVFRTRAYAREAVAFETESGEPFLFPGPRLRRMSAEQVWDSLVTLMHEDPDAPTIGLRAGGRNSRSDPATRRIEVYRRIENQTPEELVARARQIAEWTRSYRAEFRKLDSEIDALVAGGEKDPKSVSADAVRDLAERLARVDVRSTDEFGEIALWGEASPADDPFSFRTPLRNSFRTAGQRLHRAFPDQNVQRTIRQETSKIRAAEAGSSRERSADGAGMLAGAGRDAMRQRYNAILRDKGREAAEAFRQRAVRRQRGAGDSGGSRREFVRSSELPSPAPEGHFLQDFGQSDRDLIENASFDATVPQALALLNGRAFAAVMGRDSALPRLLADCDSPAAAIDAIYLAMFSRPPTAEERQVLLPEFERDGATRESASGSIVWALLNGQQFLFIE